MECIHLNEMLFIIPSLEDNLPNSVLESMACETPVIAFNVGGIPEMVQNDTTGLLSKALDTHDLSNQILQMIDHPEKRVNFEKNGRKLIKQNFSLDLQATSHSI